MVQQNEERIKILNEPYFNTFNVMVQQIIVIVNYTIAKYFNTFNVMVQHESDYRFFKCS